MMTNLWSMKGRGEGNLRVPSPFFCELSGHFDALEIVAKLSDNGDASIELRKPRMAFSIHIRHESRSRPTTGRTFQISSSFDLPMAS